jgi:hypothetical protein
MMMGLKRAINCGMAAYPQTAQIGRIGIFPADFDLEYSIIYDNWAFQELFRMEFDPEMRFGNL